MTPLDAVADYLKGQGRDDLAAIAEDGNREIASLVLACDNLAAVLEVATIAALRNQTIGPTATSACVRALAEIRGETPEETLARLGPRTPTAPPP